MKKQKHKDLIRCGCKRALKRYREKKEKKLAAFGMYKVVDDLMKGVER
jgi:hypothetical protein